VGRRKEGVLLQRNNFRGRPLCIIRGRGPRIGLDIDGVIRDIDTPIEKILFERFPQAKMVDPKAWEFNRKVSNLPKNFDVQKWLFVDKAEEVFFKARPYPGAFLFTLSLLELSKKYGGKLVYVTKQGTRSGQETLKWLAKYEFHIEELHLIKYGKSKTEAECDILIDDNLTNLKEQEELYGGAICLAQVWNEDWKQPRYTKFDEILKAVSAKLDQIEDLRRSISVDAIA